MQISSESVKIGHPDLVADSIAANIIAEILEEEKKMGLTIDTMPHCGIEVFLGKGLCVVGGEVSTRAYIDIEKSVRQTVISLGYTDCDLGLNGKSMGILNAIIPQSVDINMGTRENLGKYCEIGAGDQGIIYGFACNETPELLPLPYVLVNRMMRAFENCGNSIFSPDGKGQVTVEYDDQWVPRRVATVLMSNAVDYRHVPDGAQQVVALSLILRTCIPRYDVCEKCLIAHIGQGALSSLQQVLVSRRLDNIEQERNRIQIRNPGGRFQKISLQVALRRCHDEFRQFPNRFRSPDRGQPLGSQHPKGAIVILEEQQKLILHCIVAGRQKTDLFHRLVLISRLLQELDRRRHVGQGGGLLALNRRAFISVRSVPRNILVRRHTLNNGGLVHVHQFPDHVRSPVMVSFRPRLSRLQLPVR